MLTKSGNLSGLDNLKQSQLNLGVIETLAGEVFSTDNCVVINNANGSAFRFANRVQIALSARNLSNSTENPGPVTWAAPFSHNPHYSFGFHGDSAAWGYGCVGSVGPSGMSLYRPAGMPGYLYVRIIAIGRW